AGGGGGAAAGEARVGAEAGGGHPLVRPLSAVIDQETAAADGLADTGQPRRRDGEVDVGRADYEDAARAGGGHRRSRKSRMNRSLSTSFANRQFAAPLVRSVSPSGPMARRTGSHAASDGSSARPTASGSCSAIPC